MTSMRAKYEQEVKKALMEKYGYKSPMQIPKLDKVIVTSLGRFFGLDEQFLCSFGVGFFLGKGKGVFGIYFLRRSNETKGKENG